MRFSFLGLKFYISVPFCVMLSALLFMDKTGFMTVSLLAVLVHEAGHMFGLSHPGGRSNKDEAYMADPFSLMGLDMYLTERDFNTAFCRKIETDDKKCKRWKAKINMDNAIA